MEVTKKAVKPYIGKAFRRYFPLLVLLWVLFVLYPNPLNLVASLQRTLNPDVDAVSVEPLSTGLPSDPVAIESTVLEMIPYRYDWEVYGMPWYFPTVEEVLERGEGDCKARALVLASVFETKNIPYHINWSPIHVWVDYEGKDETSLENPRVKFYQRDPETGGKSFQLPEIALSDVLDSLQQGFWTPMPEVKKGLLVFGLLALVTLRFVWFKKRKEA